MSTWLKLFFLLLLALTATQSKAISPPNSSPNIVKVGIHLLSIDQLDLYKGTYAMDYHLLFRCSKICPKFAFEIKNGHNQSFSMDKDLPKYKIYRIRTNLQANFNARNYPFDSYWLRLEIKDQNLDKSKLIFVVDPAFTLIDKSIILHGWLNNADKIAITAYGIHPFLKTVFSKYIFSVKLERPILMGIIKVILPGIIIILFALISFVISSDKTINRFGIVSGALLGSVIFHLNLTSSLPPFGYLTYADTFMIINYLVLLIILFESVYIMRLVDSKRAKLATKADQICLVVIPIVWITLQLLNIFYFFVWFKIQ